MNNAQRLMGARLGFRIDPDPQNHLSNLDKMKEELNARGGDPQQLRMIQDKRRTLDRAVWYSYQGAFIEKLDGSHPKVKGLINPNKLKQDYDDKILSIGFEHDFHVGEVFKWCNTNTYWLIYLQDLTELAYFRGDIRRCRYTIEWLDDKGNTQKTYAAVRGPVETKIDYIQKHGISVDNPNYSLNILMPLNDETVKYFKRYSKFYLFNDTNNIVDKDYEICWRVEATDSVSMPGVLQISAVEYYANLHEDADGVVGKLITKPAEDEDTNVIKGPMLIKPKMVYKYNVAAGVTGEWKLDSKLPITKTASTLEDGSAQLELMWDDFQSSRFTLSFGEYSKEITVESLF